MAVERAGIADTASVKVVLRQLLPNAHCLKVHPEHCRHSSPLSAIVIHAVDFVEDGLYLQKVILRSAHDTDGRVKAIVIGNFRSEQVIDSLP